MRCIQWRDLLAATSERSLRHLAAGEHRGAGWAAKLTWRVVPLEQAAGSWPSKAHRQEIDATLTRLQHNLLAHEQQGQSGVPNFAGRSRGHQTTGPAGRTMWRMLLSSRCDGATRILFGSPGRVDRAVYVCCAIARAVCGRCALLYPHAPSAVGAAAPPRTPIFRRDMT
jgi:hypothetical protein